MTSSSTLEASLNHRAMLHQHSVIHSQRLINTVHSHPWIDITRIKVSEALHLILQNNYDIRLIIMYSDLRIKMSGEPAGTYDLGGGRRGAVSNQGGQGGKEGK